MTKSRTISPGQLTLDFEAAARKESEKAIAKRIQETPPEFFRPEPFGVGGISSKPTWFKGVNYRSRKEAKWAVLYDYLDIRASYEPERFSTSKGVRIPDFYLPDFEVFVEVGPDEIAIHEQKREKARGLANATGRPVLVTKGFPGYGVASPLVAGCTLALPDPYADKVGDADVIGRLFPKLRSLKDFNGPAVSNALDLARNYQFETARDFRQMELWGGVL